MATNAVQAGLRQGNANAAQKAGTRPKADAPKRDARAAPKPQGNGKPKKVEEKDDKQLGPVIREQFRASPVPTGITWANALKNVAKEAAPAPRAASRREVAEEKKEETRSLDDWEDMQHAESRPVEAEPESEPEPAPVEVAAPVAVQETKVVEKTVRSGKLSEYDAQRVAVFISEVSEESDNRLRGAAALREYEEQARSVVLPSDAAPLQKKLVFSAVVPRAKAVPVAIPEPEKEAEPQRMSWVDDVETPGIVDSTPAVSLPTPQVPQQPQHPQQLPAATPTPVAAPTPAAAAAAAAAAAGADDTPHFDRSNWGSAENGAPGATWAAPTYPRPTFGSAAPSTYGATPAYPSAPTGFSPSAGKGKRDGPFGGSSGRQNGNFSGKGKGSQPSQNNSRAGGARGQYQQPQQQPQQQQQQQQQQQSQSQSQSQSQTGQQQGAAASQSATSTQQPGQGAAGSMQAQGLAAQAGMMQGMGGKGMAYSGFPQYPQYYWGRAAYNYPAQYYTQYPWYGGYNNYYADEYYRNALPQSIRYTQQFYGTPSPSAGGKGKN